MSDFSRVSDEVISSTYVRFGSQGAPSRVEHVRELLEWLEPLLVAPHIHHIVGESTVDESDQAYMDGFIRRFLEVEGAVTEELDDLNPRGGGFTRKSTHIRSDGDLVVNNTHTGTSYGPNVQVGFIGGQVR